MEPEPESLEWLTYDSCKFQWAHSLQIGGSSHRCGQAKFRYLCDAADLASLAKRRLGRGAGGVVVRRGEVGWPRARPARSSRPTLKSSSADGARAGVPGAPRAFCALAAGLLRHPRLPLRPVAAVSAAAAGAPEPEGTPSHAYRRGQSALAALFVSPAVHPLPPPPVTHTKQNRVNAHTYTHAHMHTLCTHAHTHCPRRPAAFICPTKERQ